MRNTPNGCVERESESVVGVVFCYSGGRVLGRAGVRRSVIKRARANTQKSSTRSVSVYHSLS